VPDADEGRAGEFPGLPWWDPRVLPGWTRVTGATRITSVPSLFFGALVSVATNGHGIGVYDGLDDVAGHQWGNIEANAAFTNPVLLPHPVLLRGGIYIAVVTSLTEATILWRPATPLEAALVPP